MTVYAFFNYHSIKRDRTYRVVSEGFDYFAIKLQGKVVCVPSWVFNQPENYEAAQKNIESEESEGTF